MAFWFVRNLDSLTENSSYIERLKIEGAWNLHYLFKSKGTDIFPRSRVGFHSVQHKYNAAPQSVNTISHLKVTSFKLCF